MATPTILIGLGSTGLHVLQEVQKFYYDTYRTANKPDNTEYLYIETNESEKPKSTPIGNNIHRVFINLEDIGEMVEFIKKSCNNPTWLPDSKIVINSGEGAGGMRSCGRLALWGKHHQGNNFTNTYDAIHGAYSRVENIANNDEEKSKTTVFITGSLTGGTGSGTFIDIAYIVRDIIPNIKNLYGLFLIPNRPKNLFGEEVRLGNTYGAFKDLEHFNKIETVYNEKWPSGYLKNFEVPPFQLVQFISRDYQDGSPAISSLGGLIKMAGMFLFLNIAGIYEKRANRLVDGFGNSRIGKYGTFGLSAIQFPKDQIQEFISVESSIELIKRLINNSNYYSGGQERGIIRASIKQEISVVWDKILERAFSSLNVVKNDLLIEIEKDVLRINRNEIKGSSIDYIISMFTSERNDNFYALVSNNYNSSARNQIIDEIYNVVDTSLQSTQSLYYTKYVLEDITEAIERTLNYWKSIGLSSQPKNWDNELRKLALNTSQKTYKSILEQNNVLKDRLFAIFELLKIHHSIKPLIDIVKHIKETDTKLKGTTHILPKINFFNEVIKKCNALVTSNSAEEDSKKPTTVANAQINFPDRLKEIETDIKDTTLPIQRVFPSNSFEQECKNASNNFKQTYGAVRSMSEIIEAGNLLEYLTDKSNKKFSDEIYVDFLREFRIKSSNCVEDYDVSDFLKHNVIKCLMTAKKAISPFLRIKKVLDPDPNIPRFIIGSRETSIKETIESFTNAQTPFAYFPNHPDNICVLPDLKNILFFYDEKGNFDIVRQLEYIELLKESYEKLPDNIEDPTMTQERWNNGRNAYLTKHI